MRKVSLLLLIVLFQLALVNALDVTVKQESQEEVWIKGLDEPIVFDISIKNNGQSEIFTFYNLIGFRMDPEQVQLDTNETKYLTMTLHPRENFDGDGYYTVKYFVRGANETAQEERLSFEIITLDESFETGASTIDPESSTITLYIENTKNVHYENLGVSFDSVFIHHEEELTLDPYQRKEVQVRLNKEDFSKVTAGFYTLETTVETDGLSAVVEGVINFEEKNIVSSTDNEWGFFINTKTFSKDNQGNVRAPAQIEVSKNIISRLFTQFEPEPEFVEREGTKIIYTWKETLDPAESLNVQVRTNWFFPVILVLVLVAITLLAKKMSTSMLEIQKKVSFVKTKGGEFALKVSVRVKAHKMVERVNIIDRLPSLVKLYDHFDASPPSRVDKAKRRIEWNFERLEEGESRVISYIIYSKVGFLGTFALPKALALYEHNGKVRETTSNKAYFVAEQTRGEDEFE